MKKSFCPKNGVLSEYSNRILSFTFFQISTFLTFPDIKSDWCVVRSRFFLLTQRARLSGPFRYIEHVLKVNKKFSRGLWKQVSAQKWGFVRIFQPDFELHFFENLTFFTFPNIKSDWRVVRSRFFYWRTTVGWADLSDTLNMFVKSTKNFLEAKKKWKMLKLSQNVTSYKRFSKVWFKQTFLDTSMIQISNVYTTEILKM